MPSLPAENPTESQLESLDYDQGLFLNNTYNTYIHNTHNCHYHAALQALLLGFIYLTDGAELESDHIDPRVTQHYQGFRAELYIPSPLFK